MAPDFMLLDETGNNRALHEFKGKKVVLYFYPKDETPGCTKEACQLRNAFDEYKKHNIIILGVSYDSPASHAKFKAKHNLPFTLLSDSERKVAKLYGANNNFLGRFVPDRKTFLIDEQGNIVAIIHNVNINTHASEILRLYGIGERHT